MEQQTKNIQSPALLLGATLGGLTGLAVIALSYLGAKLAGLPFVPFDAFDFLARVLPGNVITISIDTMVNLIQSLGLGRISGTAKTLEQSMGIVLVIIGGMVFGATIAWWVRRNIGSGRTLGATLGFIVFLIVAGIELFLGSAIAGQVAFSLLWLAFLFVTWGALLGRWLSAPEMVAPTSEMTGYTQTSRRAFLIRLASGSLGVAVVAAGLGRLLELQQQASGAGQPLENFPAPVPPTDSTPNAQIVIPTPPPNETAMAPWRDRIPAAPGTRPELTANKDFYRIDIDTLPPVIDKASWKLQVAGLFDRPHPLTLTDLLAYPAVTQPITQSCISNPVAGDLISTSNWVGVRLRDLLQDLGLRPQAKELYITGADGFYESVEMQDLMDPRTLLVYGMNGETLPVDHGFPLRIYIPNRYGMKQPKWIISIEAIDHSGRGYWVDRGWSPTAYPQIISVIDKVAKDQIENGRVPVGGIAWAGDRGIRKVEVQVDGGAWAEAVLRTPPLSSLTWVQWRYDWTPSSGTHTFRVRATDGTGALQIEREQDTYPDGATGYHSMAVTI